MQVKIRHLVWRRGRGFWQPTKKMRAAGFSPEALGKDVGAAVARAEALNAEWDRTRREGARAAPKRGTVAWLADFYQRSPEYKALAKQTTREFDRLAKLALLEFGSRHIAALERRHLKAWWREQTAVVSLDHANRLINKVMRPLGRVAMDEGLIAVNPAAKLKLTGTLPRDQVWSEDEISAICTAASKQGRSSIALAVRLVNAIGQRPGDVLRLTWNQWDGRSIRLRQGKTKRWVEVLATPELRQALEQAPRAAVQIVVSETTGRPYEHTNFDARFRDARAAAKVSSDKQFMDLRRTAVVRLGEAGCTVPEISSVTGHSLKTVETILETYLPRTATMAANAIDKVVRWRES